MRQYPNHFKSYRKRYSLTQHDVVFLLELNNCSGLCRFENGSRKPAIEILLGYHLLFDTPLEDFFPAQKDEVRQKLVQKAQELLEDLRAEKMSRRVYRRLAFLDTTIKRLSSDNHDQIL